MSHNINSGHPQSSRRASEQRQALSVLLGIIAISILCSVVIVMVLIKNNILSIHWLEFKSGRSAVAKYNGSWESELSGRVLHFSSGRVLPYIQGDSFDYEYHLKVIGRLIYLTESDYQTVKEDYWERGRCPASFINGNRKQITLVSDKVSHIPDPYRGGRTLTAFELKGRGVALAELLVDGKPKKPYSVPSDMFYVESVKTWS